MRRLLIAVAFLAAYACDNGASSAPAITAACARSFHAVLEAWETRLGRVPDECALLDTRYTVSVVTEDVLAAACEPDAPDDVIGGCTQPDARTILVLGGRPEIDQVDSAVHEWVHALADCASGAPDNDHLRGELWGIYGAETIETQAQAAAQIGACL